VSASPLRPAEEAASARFAELLQEVEKLGADLSSEQIPVALGALERVRARLTFRALFSASAPAADRLLSAAEAAEVLGMAADTLYRRSGSFPFTVRDGRRVRFSRLGIERYIRARQGRV
jgi:predicted DNA-binding transcriptional regulator AlpA